jgi:hypothetical protein
VGSTGTGSAGTTGPAYPANSLWTATRYATSNSVAPSYGAVGWDNNGSWVAYQGVNFGAGLKTFNANLAVTAPYAGQKIEVFLDSLNSAPVAILITAATGGWNSFQWQSAGLLNTASGVHNVYIENHPLIELADYAGLYF